MSNQGEGEEEYDVEDNNEEEETENSQSREAVYVMTLELENQRTEHIKIYSDSDPEELAIKFCMDHKLDPSAKEYLKERIEDLLLKKGEGEGEEEEEEQIEEVEDEHEGTDEGKFVYATNEHDDSLRYNDKDGDGHILIDDNKNSDEEELRPDPEQEILKQIENEEDDEEKRKREEESEDRVKKVTKTNFGEENIDADSKENKVPQEIIEENNNAPKNEEEKEEEANQKEEEKNEISDIPQKETQEEPEDASARELKRLNSKRREEEERKLKYNINIPENREPPAREENNENNSQIYSKPLGITEYLKPQNQNNSNINRCPSTYSQKNSNPNLSIFERLFKEAELKRVLPKRACHYSNKNSISTIKRDSLPKKPAPSTDRKMTSCIYERAKTNKIEKDKKIEQKKHEKEIKERGDCTFQPNVNHIKNVDSSLASSKFRTKSSIKRAEQRRKEFQEIYTFKPKVNTREFETTFLERQKIYDKRSKERREELRQLLANSQKATPVITNKNPSIRRDDDTNVFKHNYEYYNKYKKKKEDLALKYKNEMNNSPVIPSMNTDKIANKIYSDTFSKIFKDLDSDQDNLITPINLSTKKLNKEVLRIITPLLKELRDDNHTLNEEEFISSMNRLYMGIPFVDRHILLNAYKNKRKEEYSNRQPYHPTINSNAARLAKIYDNKVEKQFNTYLNTSATYNGNNAYSGLNTTMNKGIPKTQYFRSDPWKSLRSCNSGFSMISDVAFDNYLKNLN